MKRIVTGATSLVALVVAAPLAFAQQKPDNSGDRAPAQMENKTGGSERSQERSSGQRNDSPGDKAREKNANNADRSEKSGDQRKDARDTDKSGRDDAKQQRKEARDDTKNDRKDAREDAKDQRKSSDDKMKSGDKNERAGKDSDADKSREKAEDRNQQDRSRERAGDTDRDRNQDQARDRGDQTKDGNSDQARGEVREEDRQKAEQVRSKIDNKERDRLREVAFRGDVRRASNLNIRVDLGVRLPRNVEVYALPTEIVEIAPAYRGYSYIVVDDEYCIVDPETFVIVDVIPRSGGARGQYAYRSGGTNARLDLTNDQIEIIRREVGDRGRKFDYQGDLEVGIKLPGDFAFEPFPDLVVRDLPTLRNYRFVHVEDEIAIVAPDQPEVVFVIGD